MHKLKHISLIIISTSFLFSCSNKKDGDEVPSIYRDVYISETDCVKDWLKKELCVFNTSKDDFVELKEYQGFELYDYTLMDRIESKKSNTYLDFYYGPPYLDKNDRKYKNIVPENNNAPFIFSFTSAKSAKYSDGYNMNYNEVRDSSPSIKEIRDVYNSFEHCIKDWSLEAMCTKRINKYYSPAYTLDGRLIELDNDKAYIPTTDNSKEYYWINNNGQAYYSNVNPVDLTVVEKVRDIYLEKESCLKDWKHDELCEHDNNDNFISPIYDANRREAIYKDDTYKPTAKNMNYYYILYSNGDSYVSKSPKFLKSLREEKSFSYGSPFDEIKTSTGKISHKKIKYANDIHEYSANSLAYASRPDNPKKISNLESILYGLN